MTNSISCPVCSNICSTQATACPKCGHPFKVDEIRKTKIGNERGLSKSPNIWKILTILVGILVVCLLSYGAYSYLNRSNTPDTQKSRVISFKAALVYKTGAQPVARTKFYLLNRDLKVLDEDKNAKSVYTPPSVAKGLPQMGLPPTNAGIKEENIKEYIVTTTTTDFEGNAKFENVPNGTYYIGGFTTARSEYGYIVWSVKVDSANNKETLLLDQNNAFKAEEY